jgi:chorismate-pyruvate lyase
MTRVATDLTEKLFGLDPAHRLLLTSDGTLTTMLETVHLERITLVPVAQHVRRTEQRVESLILQPGELLLTRQVLLKGGTTRKTYVYAESLIVLSRLNEQIWHALLTSNTPIGRLWKENRIETFKELLDFGIHPAGKQAVHFEFSPETPLMMRSSRVSSGGKPIALITEHLRYESVERVNNGLRPSLCRVNNKQIAAFGG